MANPTETFKAATILEGIHYGSIQDNKGIIAGAVLDSTVIGEQSFNCQGDTQI